MFKFAFIFKESLRIISEDMAQKYGLKPGQKLCPRCYQRCIEQEAEQTDSDSDYEPQSTARQALDTSSQFL